MLTLFWHLCLTQMARAEIITFYIIIVPQETVALFWCDLRMPLSKRKCWFLKIYVRYQNENPLLQKIAIHSRIKHGKLNQPLMGAHIEV